MENINLEQEEQRKNSLAEQGEYKTLLTEEQNKNVELSKQFEEISTAFNGYVQEERNALLSQIPESKREKFEKVEDLTLLRTIAGEFNQKTGVNVGNVENQALVLTLQIFCGIIDLFVVMTCCNLTEGFMYYGIAKFWKG